jgi:phosphoribosylanthranilate isomerase
MRYGVSAIGLVAQMPSGPGVIPEDTIADIADWLPPGISSFLLTSSQDSEEIIAQHKRCRTNTIQIVDKLTKGAYLNLKRSLPGVKIVQVIHVTGPESVEEVSQLSQQPIDAFLLDSGRPNLAIKELGGTGRVHDWMVSKKIIEQSPIPVYLAGGLNPDNVLEAVARLRPFGVDVCSGLRTGAPGYDLDEQKLSAFVQRLGLVGLSRGGSSSLGD